MKKILKPLGFYNKQLVIGPFFKLIEAIFELIVPIVMATIIDVGVANRDTAYVIKMGILIIILGIVGLGCAIICQHSAAVASQGYGTRLRNQLFTHINSLSYEQLEGMSSSVLITRMTNDINQLQLAVAMLIRLVVRAPFIAVGATVMAIILDYKLSLIIISAIAMVSLTIFVVMKLSVPHFKVMQGKLEVISRITKENLSGIRVVRAFTKEDYEIKRFEDASDDLVQTTLKVGKLSALLSPLVTAVMNIAIVLLLWFGGVRVNSSSMTQGELIAFVNYITQILLAVVVVSNLVVIFTKAFACANRVESLLSILPDKTYGDLDSIDTRSNVIIELEGASYSYLSKELLAGREQDVKLYAVCDVSLQIKKGQTIGIIGGTGCGKTTLINLINKNLDATNGKVKLYGKGIDSYKKGWFNRNIAVVMQKTLLLNQTIRENMRVAKSNATDNEIMLALKKADAYNFVMDRSEGLDFVVEAGAKNLSGGQRQRLCIARALLSEAKILILDDCYSALDYKTERAISENIKSDDTRDTIIVISQRIRSIMGCDQIVFMDNGKVTAVGRHEELLQKSDKYCEIVKSSQME